MHQYSAYQYFRAYLVWAEQSCSRLAAPPTGPLASLSEAPKRQRQSRTSERQMISLVPDHTHVSKHACTYSCMCTSMYVRMRVRVSCMQACMVARSLSPTQKRHSHRNKKKAEGNSQKRTHDEKEAARALLPAENAECFLTSWCLILPLPACPCHLHTRRNK